MAAAGRAGRMSTQPPIGREGYSFSSPASSVILGTVDPVRQAPSARSSGSRAGGRRTGREVVAHIDLLERIGEGRHPKFPVLRPGA